MIQPIVAYGDPVLKTRAVDLNPGHEGLEALIADMWQTMYHAQGVGLAAPQVGKSLRLFIIDASPFADEDPSLKDFKKVFINARILEESGTPWVFNEGCLSFPDLREDIYRKPEILLSYFDEHFQPHEERFSGLAARIIQHEYDHIEGVVMVDRISPLKKTLIRKKLQNIIKGAVKADYPIRFAQRKK